MGDIPDFTFDVKIAGDTVSLGETGNIESRELVAPNAIVALDRARFFVANDHGSTTATGKMLEDLLILPRANVLFFDGMVFRPAADHGEVPARFSWAGQAPRCRGTQRQCQLRGQLMIGDSSYTVGAK